MHATFMLSTYESTEVLEIPATIRKAKQTGEHSVGLLDFSHERARVR